MPIFQYDQYRNAYGPSIAEALAHQNDAPAQAALRIGDLQAQGAERTAALQGQLWTQLGNIPAQIAASNEAAQKLALQKQQSQLVGQQIQEGALTLSDKQAQHDADRQLSTIFANTPRNADGTYDTRAFINNVPPELTKYAGKWVQQANAITDTWLADDARRKGTVQASALALLQAGAPFQATQGLIDSAHRDRVLTDDQATQYKTQLVEDPTGAKTVLRILGGYQKPITKKDDESLLDPATLGTLVPSTPKANWDPVKDLQGPNGEPLFLNKDTRQLVTAAGVNVMNPIAAKKADTANADRDRYLQLGTDAALGKPLAPADQAWMKIYEKEKLLATDTSASAAATRQASAQAAATAQQQRAQDFTQLQAARSDLRENVDKPYATAKAGADTLRDVVTAAQQGNKVAGSLQSLETTMAAIKAQGLNRINMPEVASTAQAGTLWDHIAGYVGKKLEGQPVPPDIQKDMLAFADLLDRAAYKKYAAAHAATNTLYQTQIPPTYAPPAAGAGTPAAPALSPGLQGLLNRP